MKDMREKGEKGVKNHDVKKIVAYNREKRRNEVIGYG